MPAVALVTFTVTVQVDPAFTDAPLSEMVVLAAAAVTEPLVQVVEALAGVATLRLVGSESVNAPPVDATGLALGLPSVKVTVDVPLAAILVGLKASLKVGAPTTSVVSVPVSLLASSSPPPPTVTMLV